MTPRWPCARDTSQFEASSGSSVLKCNAPDVRLDGARKNCVPVATVERSDRHCGSLRLNRSNVGSSRHFRPHVDSRADGPVNGRANHQGRSVQRRSKMSIGGASSSRQHPDSDSGLPLRIGHARTSRTEQASECHQKNWNCVEVSKCHSTVQILHRTPSTAITRLPASHHRAFMLTPCSASSMLFATLRPGRWPGLRALTTPPRGTFSATTRWSPACRSLEDG